MGGVDSEVSTCEFINMAVMFTEAKGSVVVGNEESFCLMLMACSASV